MFEIVALGFAMLLAGLAGGLLAGLLGVGGGLVIVPALEFALGFAGVDPSIRMHVAVGTSLATIIPTSISSTRAHHRRGAVDVAFARAWAPWIFFGALAGAWLASRLDSRALTLVFSVVAALVALRMIAPSRNVPAPRPAPRGILAAAVPALIGMLSAMMGIGGGSLTVPVMSALGVSIHRAVGTAALFGLVIAVPGTLGFMLAGQGSPLLPAASVGFVSLLGFALIAPVTWLVAPLGARLAHALDRRKLTLVFGLFLLLVAGRMFLRAALGG